MLILLDKKIIFVAIAMAVVSAPFLFSNSDKFAVVAIYFIALTAYLLQRYSHEPERNKTTLISILALIGAIAWAYSRWESGLFGIISSVAFVAVVVAARYFTRKPRAT